MKTTPWIRHVIVPQAYAPGNLAQCVRCHSAVPVPEKWEAIVCQKDDAWLFGDEPNAKDCQ